MWITKKNTTPSVDERKEEQEAFAPEEKPWEDGKEMDMIHGSLWNKIILFAMPLALSSILQQLFNSADVAVVGRFAGKDALAAVGANVANVAVFVNLLVGMSIGPNVIISNLIGHGKRKEVPKVVGTSMCSALVIGLIFLVLIQILAGPLMVWSAVPEDVRDLAEIYLRIYMLGLPFMMIYNFGAAVLRSVGNTRTPLLYMTLAGVVNLILNIGFVVGASMGVAGVALATVLSNILSAVLVLRHLWVDSSIVQMRKEFLRIDSYYMKKILLTGLPAGIQSSVFSLSNMFIQTGINHFGSAIIAGAAAGLNFEYFTYDIVLAFASANVTFYGQNYGAGETARSHRVFYLSMGLGALFTGILSGIFMIWAVPLTMIYSTDPVVIDYAIRRMTHVMSLEPLCVLFEMPAAALRAMNYSILPSVITILGTVVFRIVWMLTIFKKVGTYEILMDVYPVSWVVTGVMLLVAYYVVRGRREV